METLQTVLAIPVFIIVVGGIFVFIPWLILRKSTRDINTTPTAENIRKAGMNPDNTLILRVMRSAPGQRWQIYTFVEIRDDNTVRYYANPESSVVGSIDTIVGIGIDRTPLFSQAQMYADVSKLNVRNINFNNGVIVPGGFAPTMGSNRKLFAKIERLAAKHNIPIVPLQHKNDIRSQALVVAIAAVIGGSIALAQVFL